MITFGSLFAGIGGFDLGFERAGMKCAWQCEIDEYATRILEKHWPNVRRWRDIRTFPPEPIDDWRVDLICGGFPCQDISYAGRGAGLDGERSGLFYEAMRVIRILEPRFFVLENVAALLTRGLDAVLGSLAAVGYDAEWHCIPAAAVGTPHIRDRVFVLAYRKNNWSGWWEQQSESCEETRYVADTAGVRRESRRTSNAKEIKRRREPYRSSIDVNVSDAISTRPQERQRTQGQWAYATTAGSNWWSFEPDVGRVANGVPSRVDRLRCLGNAVVPQVAEWIGRAIVNSLEHKS